jgi:threonine dehydratase
VLDRADIDAAAGRIQGWVRRTPVQPVDPGDDWLPSGGCFKLELLQHTGTFKARGAFNRLLVAAGSGELDSRVGIVVASGGNAGLANACAAARLGVPATVFVPETAPPIKLSRLVEYGAHVVRRGSEYAEAHEAAMEQVERTGALYCHAYDQLEICAGAGTLGVELLEQLAAVDEQVDTVLVAVGGGGLLAGVVTAAQGRLRVVGVEPTLAPTLHAALANGGPLDVAVSGVAADCLGARRLGAIAWDVVQRAGVTSVLVDEDAIMKARQQLWSRYRLAVEAGAAVTVAALASGAYRPEPNERIAVILCGANTGPSDLA